MTARAVHSMHATLILFVWMVHYCTYQLVSIGVAALELSTSEAAGDGKTCARHTHIQSKYSACVPAMALQVHKNDRLDLYCGLA